MALDTSELRKARQHMQMIFQDPFASLNPQMLLSHQVAEPMQNFGGLSASERNDRDDAVRPGAAAAHFMRAIRTSCRAVSGSGSPSPGRWR
jgi:ABC-type microcin C transport system duplicated ATPase subunit YejF